MLGTHKFVICCTQTIKSNILEYYISADVQNQDSLTSTSCFRRALKRMNDFKINQKNTGSNMDCIKMSSMHILQNKQMKPCQPYVNSLLVSAPEKIFHISLSHLASLKPRQIQILGRVKFRNDNFAARSPNQVCMIYSEAMRIFIYIYHKGIYELIFALQNEVSTFQMNKLDCRSQYSSIWK